ncbi:Uncharacterised protein [Mycolicibacterium phlei]|uniref:DUF1330 domain-containing protein n=1 Tax=Mycolicibacterium phlei DSM 43239 = CCUG 21000 TaxID=1226750 RepID=A0A5N5UWW9_MYCPH|nr:hypothetical protein [Mycolicibacterium phlei]VEG09456.1 Uncharacterised protein [Mycobacteroides chelonae]AMO61341.1 hypothetical protein MPHLCCUG_02529 [Mycolicibacterium phlei]KAB7752660.1 hypothetical protein MPHL21000_20850 [Mycolicibacterium phlei DSM 43239 = CCUG 21000]KXW61013.1 hypothetical protein MPHL43239_22625 [Mycolicibacterium phlei DSM 43239 = CCUG 21000]KXW63008.1 hypothetical protein MPHL43072_08725 [Mycolicibacterium phlei DSM 43072]
MSVTFYVYLEWPSQAALDGYMADPRRTSLAADRDRAIERTDIVVVQPVVTPAT